MDIGIGLPSMIASVRGRDVITWARQAEDRGFASVGVLDRLVYDSYEPLVTLAAVASVTERVRLTTAVLILSQRVNAALLAKQAASIDQISGGRLVLGLAVGGRADDFEASQVPLSERGTRFERMLEEMRAVWAGQPRGMAGRIGPAPVRQSPTVIIGGAADAVFDRVGRYAEGWIAGGGPATMYAQFARRASASWSAHGRPDRPRLMAIRYFALGASARDDARDYLTDYYSFLPSAEPVVQSALTDEASIRAAVTAYAEAGCDELILFPCSPDPAQVDLLADAVLGR